MTYNSESDDEKREPFFGNRPFGILGLLASVFLAFLTPVDTAPWGNERAARGRMTQHDPLPFVPSFRVAVTQQSHLVCALLQTLVQKKECSGDPLPSP